MTHELGHAFFIRKSGLVVDYIYISPLHGSCHYSYDSDYDPPSSIAYGGVLAQSLAASVWIGLFQFVNISEFDLSYNQLLKFSDYFIALNIGMAMFNFLPIPGLDGELIWRHIGSKIRSNKRFGKTIVTKSEKKRKVSLEKTKGAKVVNIKRAK